MLKDVWLIFLRVRDSREQFYIASKCILISEGFLKYVLKNFSFILNKK